MASPFSWRIAVPGFRGWLFCFSWSLLLPFRLLLSLPPCFSCFCGLVPLVSAVVLVLRLVIVAVADIYGGIGVNVRMGDRALTSGSAVVGGSGAGGNGDGSGGDGDDGGGVGVGGKIL